ncbi:MAG: hypothetical protein Q4C34_09325 [Bacteroidales bacterium]|nr:hypothetical protein [Bacteroidales bacterium]
MRDRQLTQRLISALVLTLFLMFQAGTHAFMHLHTVDGVTVAHSHPYKETAHTHTAAQIESIASVSNITTDEPGSLAPDLHPPLTWGIVRCGYTITAGHPLLPGRESLPAPPVVEMI